MNLVDELYAITTALHAAKIPYAVCGGIAVAAYGAPRHTKDIDIVIGPENVAAALEAVRPLGYAFPALPMTFEAETERERHVQRVSKLDGKQHLTLDFLLAEAAYARALDESVNVALPKGPITFVSKATLVAMKRLAARPLDLVDVERLEADEDA